MNMLDGIPKCLYFHSIFKGFSQFFRFQISIFQDLVYMCCQITTDPRNGIPLYISKFWIQFFHTNDIAFPLIKQYFG